MNGILDRYDLFIFDWDGTLSEIKFMNVINERLNFLWLRRKERSRRQALYTRRSLLKKEMNEAKDAKEYKSIVDFLMLISMPNLHKGSLESLRLIRRRGKKAVLFTNGAYWRVATESKHLHVLHYFDFLLSAQRLPLVKPNPLGLNLIIKREKARRSRTLYIGDMVDDVLMARLAKVDCAAVSCGFDKLDALKAEKPRYLFKDIEEFYGKLRKGA